MIAKRKMLDLLSCILLAYSSWLKAWLLISLSLIDWTLVEFDFKFFVFFFLALNTFQKIPTERGHSKT